MKKSQIEFHSDGFRPSHPAVNVKDYSRNKIPAVQLRFRCCHATAQRALEFAWQAHCEQFWEQAQEDCAYFLGEGTVYSEGRSGGWLVVHGLPSVETWDAIRVSKWGRFAKAMRDNADYLTSAEAMIETIDANNWAPADALLDDEDAEAEEAADCAARGILTIALP